MSQPETPWFADGLAFTCTRCGNCCTGAPGFVWVDDEEITRLADFLKLSFEQFCKKYVRQIGEHFSLIEKPGGDCIFWAKDRGCTVYEARPVQCRTWPFWSENFETPAAWAGVKRGCPGAGQGQVFSVEEILASAARVHHS